jgi:uncharacterized membrane protein
MTIPYNRLSVRSLDRIAALSDAVFAFAMTLIVLEIHVPDPGPITTDAELWNALGALGPRFVTYLLSLMTLGIFWNAQQTQFRYVDHADRNFTWISLTWLAAVTTIPFTTSLLAEFITFRLALAIYWLNIFLLGMVFFWTWIYAKSASLLTPEATAEISDTIRRRVVVAQSLYAFGALLAIWSTYLSIGFIVLVQLYYALGVGHRIPLLRHTVIGRS